MPTVKNLILFSIFSDIFLISQVEFQLPIIVLYLLFCYKTFLDILCGNSWLERDPWVISQCYVNSTGGRWCYKKEATKKKFYISTYIAQR